MVFTAHKPHPANKESFLGYYKDDGFVIRKGKGRIDALLRWEGIKRKWVTLFINRQEEPKLSIKQIVTAKDEWCAEAYMETDYSTLSKQDFIDEVKRYAAFKVMNS
jgi:hypothetical protein